MPRESDAPTCETKKPAINANTFNSLNTPYAAASNTAASSSSTSRRKLAVCALGEVEQVAEPGAAAAFYAHTQSHLVGVEFLGLDDGLDLTGRGLAENDGVILGCFSAHMALLAFEHPFRWGRSRFYTSDRAFGVTQLGFLIL